MFYINKVLMDGNDIGASVEKLEDNVIANIVKAVPHISAMEENDAIVTMVAVAAYVTDNSTVDINSISTMNRDKFNINVSIIGKMLAKEINETIAFDVNMFSRYFSMVMSEKYAYLLGTPVLYTIINEGSVIPEPLTKLLADKRNILLSTYNRLK